MGKKSALKSEVNKKKPLHLQCKICFKSGFTSDYNLNSHLFFHNAVKARYKCSYCPKEFYRSDTYTRHVAMHENRQKLHYCDHCDRGFVDKRNLIIHLNIHDDLSSISKYRYKCAACGVDYCEERLLIYHVKKEHLTSNSNPPKHTTKNLNETWIESIKDSKHCMQITKVTPNKLIMKSCKAKYKDESRNDNEKNLFQQYKASVFATKNNGYSKAICDYCGKEMLRKSILPHIRERHLKIHRFHCDVCNRGFKRHYQLGMHDCGKRPRRRSSVNKF